MIRKIYFITLSILCFLSVQSQENTDIVIGKRLKINSEILNDSVSLQIYKPQNQNNSKQIYPVIYLLNGEAYFHTVTGVVNQLAKAHEIPECIVVGLNPDNKYFLNKNESKIYFDFLESELNPYLQKNHQASPCKIVIAHSIYAQLALYGLMSKENAFSSYILSSPFFTINDYLHDFEHFVDNGNVKKFNLQLSCGFENGAKMDKIYKLARVINRAFVGNSNWEYKYYNNIDRESVFLKTLTELLPENFNDLNVRQPLADPSDFESKFSQREVLNKKYGCDYLDLEKAPKSIGQKILEDIDNKKIISKKTLDSHQNLKGYFYDPTEILNVIEYLKSIGKTKESKELYALLPKSKTSHEFVNNYTDKIELERGLLYNLTLDSANLAMLQQEGAQITDVKSVEGIDKNPSSAISMTSGKGKIKLDYSSQYDPKKSISISCWIYPNQLRNADSWAISMKPGNKGPHWNTTVGSYPDQWGFELYTIGRFVYLVNDSIQTKQWNHIVIVADQSIGRLTFYKNGIQIAQRNDLVPFLDNSELLQIGNDIFSFDGRIDEFRLYQRALSASEVKELYSYRKD